MRLPDGLLFWRTLYIRQRQPIAYIRSLHTSTHGPNITNQMSNEGKRNSTDLDQNFTVDKHWVRLKKIRF